VPTQHKPHTKAATAPAAGCTRVCESGFGNTIAANHNPIPQASAIFPSVSRDKTIAANNTRPFSCGPAQARPGLNVDVAGEEWNDSTIDMETHSRRLEIRSQRGQVSWVGGCATISRMDRQYIIGVLRAHEPELRAAGIVHLRVFGSVARGESSDASDVDLMAEFDKSNNFTLVRLANSRLLPRPRIDDPLRMPRSWPAFPEVTS